jgi:hypothetical protein
MHKSIWNMANMQEGKLYMVKKTLCTERFLFLNRRPSLPFSFSSSCGIDVVLLNAKWNHWVANVNNDSESLRQINKLVPSVYIAGVSSGQKWGRTVLEIENSCSQWKGSACGEEGGEFYSFFLCSQRVPFKFLMSSHQVLNAFPKCVLNSTSL